MFLLNEGEVKVFRVLIKHVEEKKGSRNVYSNVVFTDGEAEMASNIWVSAAKFPYEGKVVDLTLTMKMAILTSKEQSLLRMVTRQTMCGMPLLIRIRV